MEVKIRGKGKNKLRLEIEDGDYSLINLLRKNLWDEVETEVTKAEERKGHTYLDNFEFLVESKSGDPTEALVQATEKVQKDSEEFKKKIDKAL